MLGRQISHYRILELLGEGGMGVVYRAEDLDLGRPVAIKIVKPTASDPAEARQRFLREARVASRIDHPNVITVYEVLQEEEASFLVMQFVEGGSLRQFLAGRMLPVPEALKVARGVASGLQAAHRLGVVHRDLKPDNVMMARDGTCKVLDFGLAHLADHSTLTSGDTILGTVPYMAPEQVRGDAIDARTDVYALGVLMFEMLAGRLPFTEQEGVALMHRVLNSEPPALESLRPDLPDGVSRVVSQALQKKPADRYQDIADLIHDLDVILARLPSAEGVQSERLRARGRLRRQRVRAAAAVGLAAVLAALAWYLSRPGVLGGAAQPRVLVMQWESRGAPPDPVSQWLPSGIMDCMIRSLAGRDGFQVISRQTVASTLDAMKVEAAGVSAGDVLGAARRLGAAYLVTGSVDPDGPGARIDCELMDVRKGLLVRSWTQDLNDVRSRFYPAIDALAGGISEELGRRTGRRAGAKPSLAATLTPSLEALKSYQLALDARETGDVTESLGHLERALAFDSTFTEAHLMLSRLSPELATKRDHLALAWKYRAQASPKTRLLVEAEELTRRRQYEPTRRKLLEVLSLDPEDVLARATLARLDVHRRRFEDAVGEYEVLHQLNPFDYSYFAWWTTAYIEVGRTDKALALLTDWRRRFPGAEAPLVELIGTYKTLGDYALALAFCDTLDQLRPAAADVQRGFLLMDLGRVREAEVVLARTRRTRDPSRAASRADSYLALAAYRRGEYGRGLALVDSALQKQPDTYNLWIAGILAAGAGDTSRAGSCARQIAARIDVPESDSTTEEAYGDRRFYFHLLALIRRAEHDPADAVPMCSRALRYASRVDDPYFRTWLGRTLIEAGDPARASEELGRVLAFNPRYPEALLELGRARGLLRHPQQAREPLLALKDLWKEADRDDPMNLELERLLALTPTR